MLSVLTLATFGILVASALRVALRRVLGPRHAWIFTDAGIKFGIWGAICACFDVVRFLAAQPGQHATVSAPTIVFLGLGVVLTWRRVSEQRMFDRADARASQPAPVDQLRGA